MEYRYLGKTGLRVSRLCLGAMHFGSRTNEELSHRILDEFTDAGGSFIDTADSYGQGESEAVIGRWLRHRERSDVVVATKMYGRLDDDGLDSGHGRNHILAAVDASLRRLDTDYIDVYYTHMFDDTRRIEETLATLDTVVRTGKVRYLGACNVTGWQLQKAVDLCRQHGWARYDALQPRYNLIDRETEWDLLAVCRNEGLGVIPWAPLRTGWLSGRFKRGMTAPPVDTRVYREGVWQDLQPQERAWEVLDVLHDIAAETGHSVAQVALRWLMQCELVTAAVVGSRTVEQATDNLGAVDWELTQAQFKRLCEASDKPKGYPHDILGKYAPL